MGAMRKEVVVLCIYSILNVQLIGFPGGLHVLRKVDQLCEQEGTEERRADMMKVMTILCHSKSCAKNKRDRGLATSQAMKLTKPTTQ